MKLKKLIALGLATVMSASILVGCSAKSNSDSSAKDQGDKIFKVGMITDIGGVNDESFTREITEEKYIEALEALADEK